RPRVETITADLLDRIDGGDGFDLVKDFAYPLPVIVIAEMLGVPAADRTAFQEWSAVLVRGLDPLVSDEEQEVVFDARDALLDYLRGVLMRRRREPQEDMLTSLIAAEENGDIFSEGELLAMCNLLLVAGHETTVNLIGNGVLALLENPDQLDRLRRDPDLIGTAVDELLRYTSPVQWTGRVAAAEIELGGRTIQPPQSVIGILGAANRHPPGFPDPDRRPPRPPPHPPPPPRPGLHPRPAPPPR